MKDFQNYLDQELKKVHFEEISNDDNNSSISSIIGLEIKRLREKKGLTQKDLAKKINIQQSNLSKIESGLANPNIQTLDNIAKGLGATIKIVFKEF